MDLIGIILFYFVATAMIVIPLFLYKREKNFHDKAITTKAVIVDSAEGSSPNFVEEAAGVLITLSYKDELGKEYIKKFNVPTSADKHGEARAHDDITFYSKFMRNSEMSESKPGSHFQPGKVLYVIYNKENPQHSYIEAGYEKPKLYKTLVVAGSFLLCIAIGGTIMNLVNSMSAAQ